MTYLDQFADTILYIDQQLALSLNKQGVSPRLLSAMQYAVLGRGKRVRPLLVFECARAVLGTEQIVGDALPAALAVEYVHAYSLIHDDLPAMDDDDIRRGKPTLHKAFDEATAILAGDALFADAFALLALAKTAPARQCAELALATGSLGMCSGQMEDILFERRENPTLDLRTIHLQKTAKLFAVSCALGAISANAPTRHVDALRNYGESVGMAFQIHDDQLDNDGNSQVGQTLSSQIYVDTALQVLDTAGLNTESLRHIARFTTERGR